jgi:hypothetical protein
MAVERRDQGVRVDGSAKDERQDRSRNATVLAIFTSVKVNLSDGVIPVAQVNHASPDFCSPARGTRRQCR